jgi:hypothetical protein
MVLTQMNEWELYSYHDICYLTSRKALNKHDFFQVFIRYKMSKVMKSATTRKFVENYNEYRMKEVKDRIMIKSKLIISYSPLEFCDRIVEEWYDLSEFTIEKIKLIMETIYPELKVFSESTAKLVITVKNSKVLMFKLYNLFKIMALLTNMFQIESKL